MPVSSSALKLRGRWSEETATVFRLIAEARAACRRAPRCSGRLGAPLEWHSFACRAASLRHFVLNFLPLLSSVLLVTRPICTNCWLTHAGSKHPPAAASQPARRRLLASCTRTLTFTVVTKCKEGKKAQWEGFGFCIGGVPETDARAAWLIARVHTYPCDPGAGWDSSLRCAVRILGPLLHGRMHL